MACPTPSAPTTASPSPARMASSTSPSSPSGGSGSASPSSASSPAIPSRTAATSACTSPSRRRPPARPASTACSSRPASMPSSRVQYRTAARSPRHELPRRGLCPLARPYPGLPELDYPLHDRDVLVTACGRICMHRKKINISTVLAGQRLGIKEVDDGIWLVSFMRLRSGLHRSGAKNPATPRQPLRAEGVTHVLGTVCYLCVRAGHLKSLERAKGIEPSTLSLGS